MSKDAVTTTKGKHLHCIRDKVGKKRFMIEINNFRYIGSTLNEDITSRCRDQENTNHTTVVKLVHMMTG